MVLRVNFKDQPLLIQGGVDGYYLNTRFYKDQDNVLIFESNFNKKRCSTCFEEGFGFEFRAASQALTTKDIVEATLRKNKLDFRRPTNADSTLQLNKISLSYRDSSGTLYRTDMNRQPPGSFFEVIQVDDFQRNEKGDKTKKLSIRFQCTFFKPGPDGKPVLLPDVTGEGIIAVAYPE